MIRTRKRKWGIMVARFMVLCMLLIPTGKGVAEEDHSMPTAEDTLFPTVEELTQGKVKVGDTITKENVDLVKDLVAVGAYESVKRGSEINIVKNYPPGKFTPPWYREATEENHKKYGNPVFNENLAAYTKDGKPWPGGMLFPRPSNVTEIILNAKYGTQVDDEYTPTIQGLVDKEGKLYKKTLTFGSVVWCNMRTQVPPLGSWPGHEKEYRRFLTAITSPRDNRGLGQIIIRYWDEVENPDEGFVYLPAFKRCIRVSATTYQDQMAGGDATYGEIEGFFEPFSYWDFKLIETKPMLVSLPASAKPAVSSDGELDPAQFVGGAKHIRGHYGVALRHVVECTPRINHIYGRKVLYVFTAADWPLMGPFSGFEDYDRAGELWKGYVTNRLLCPYKGQNWNQQIVSVAYDFQSGHSTLEGPTSAYKVNLGPDAPHDPERGSVKQDPTNFTLQTLIATGR